MLERLTGTVQPYPWGSSTVLPDFLQVEPNGQPQAELWLGSHELAPSRVGDDPLNELVSDSPQAVLGGRSLARFGPKLPYLMKVLAPAQPLSLQVHPSRGQAVAGFAREEALGVPRDAPHRMYRDDWPKPELYCALQRTEALCGFRPPAETYRLFERLGVTALLRVAEPLRDGTVEQLKVVFERLLRLADGTADLVREVGRAGDSAAPDEADEPDVLALARTARELGSLYPRDPGVLAALLLNRVALAPMQALYLPAGNIHAYLNGHGVEIMANSDNVVRVGLTPKYVNVDELLTLVDFTPGLHTVVAPVEASPGVWGYPTPAEEFALWRVDVRPGQVACAPGKGGGRIALATSGSVTLEGATGRLTLSRGQSAVVGADEASVQVTGDGTVFVGGPAD
jgi:mannose-6-phosphate isomerase